MSCLIHIRPVAISKQLPERWPLIGTETVDKVTCFHGNLDCMPKSDSQICVNRLRKASCFHAENTDVVG